MKTLKKDFKIQKLETLNQFLVVHKSGFKMTFQTEGEAEKWIADHIKFNTKF